MVDDNHFRVFLHVVLQVLLTLRRGTLYLSKRMNEESLQQVFSNSNNLRHLFLTHNALNGLGSRYLRDHYSPHVILQQLR